MAHEEIYRELNECRASGEFVACHRRGDDPSLFVVGVVLELSSTRVTFRDVNPRGQYEEEFSVPLRSIHTLDRGTRYLWRLKILNENEATEPAEIRDLRKPAEVRAFLEDAAQKRSIVHLWTSVDDHEDVIVHAVGEGVVTVASVFEGGPEDGRTMIRLSRIKRVRHACGEHDETVVHRYGLEHGFPPM